jgi:hypothetical protein
MKKTRIAFLLFSGICFGQQADTNTFISQTAGIKITKPAHWNFIGLEAIKENREKVKLQDKKMDEGVKKANAPLVAIMKYKEPYDDINPSFQVLVRPLGTLAGKTAAEIWSIMIPGLQKAYKDFKVLKKPHDIEIDGKKASEIEISYAVETQDGRQFKSQSRMIMWLKENHMYQFGMSFPQKASHADLSELDGIVKSIKLL